MPGRALAWLVLGTLLALAGAFLGMPAVAQTALAGRALPVCVAPVRVGDTAAAMLRADARFDCTTPQSAFGAGNYWVRSAPIAGGDPAFVRSASVWQDRATLHIAYADGARIVERMDGRDAARALRPGAIFQLPLPHRTAPVTRLLWHIEGAANLRGIVVAPRLATLREAADTDLLLGTLYGAFGGLCLALIVYNLALWGALRHPFQLTYCMMVGCLMAYAFSSSGALAWAWPGIANNDRMRVNYLALALSGAAAMGFARDFFEAHVFRGWIGRVTVAVMVALPLAGLGFACLAPWHLRLLDRIYAGAFLLLLLVTVPMLTQAWRRRSNYLWLFGFAWAAPITLAGFRVAARFNLVGFGFLLDNSTIASMALEALLSSLAIAYRIRLLARERDEAHEKAIAARLLADVDPLTGLFNRRAFLREAIGQKIPQLLIVADIDHFKRVNETLGHDGGDEALRLVCRAFRAAAPDGLIARLGGEEFAILVPAYATAMPAAVLERVRAERMPFDLRVTVSIGTSTGMLETESDWNALYRQADQALFAAKAAGRDRARHAA